MGHAGKLRDDLAFKVLGVEPVVGAAEGIPDIVDRIREEGEKVLVIEILIARVADVPGTECIKPLMQGIKTLASADDREGNFNLGG